MQKAHDATKNDYWRNKPITTSPINQDNLNRMEVTMDVIDDRVVTFDTTKANQSDLLQTVKTVTYAPLTGTFTFTHWNGSTSVINTDIEKIAINFDYDDDPTSAHYQQLVIELDDGTYKYVDLSALITEYEFIDTTTIAWTVESDGSIKANIPDGSITGQKLQPNYLADCVAAKNGAETKALVSEGWAVGTQNGTPVTSESPYYHNNSKYWKDQAESIVSGGHTIVNPSGTSMAQRHNLQFKGSGVTVTDNQSGDTTEVNISIGNGATRLQSLDFVGKTYTFNADGSISVVADDYTETIVFNADGTITDSVVLDGVTTTKTTTFGNNTITEVLS